MAEYVDLNGIHTWYDKQGEGESLVMLHPGGGGVDSRAYGPNINDFTSHFTVFLPERRGHGRTSDSQGPYSFDMMAEDTIVFIDKVVGGPTLLMGMSDGAIVALLVARKRPDLVKRLVFVAAPFHYNGWDEGVLQPGVEPPAFLEESYAAISPDGREHYRTVVNKIEAMHATGPTLTVDDLKNITCRSLVMFGDDDEVRLEHVIDLYRNIPDCELAIIPGTSHGLMVEKPELCDGIILDFLIHDPVQTLAPRRRKIMAHNILRNE